MEPIKTEAKRNPDGTFAEGTAPGPGRPKGQSLKEFWKQRFALMTDEEKLEFSKNVAPELLYRMAEGNPHSTEDTDITSGGKVLQPILVKFLDDDRNTV